MTLEKRLGAIEKLRINCDTEYLRTDEHLARLSRQTVEK